MSKNRKYFKLNEPLRHSHKPMTRRGFLAQGFTTGAGALAGVSTLSMLTARAYGVSPAMFDASGFTPAGTCDLANVAGRRIPFICIDLAGGANIAGSNVLVGGQGGQKDFLSTAGYSKLGLPGDMIPPIADPNNGATDFINEQLGLAFHSDSAMLRGILNSATATTQMGTNGAVIPSRSDNDTGNNTHNPMYAIKRAGAKGKLLQLIGSQTSESGGNSMAPPTTIDPELRPTKVDRPSDVTGLVDVGGLSTVLSEPSDVVSVLESMKAITDMKLASVNTGQASVDLELKQRISCEYLKSADTYRKFNDASALDPSADPLIVEQPDQPPGVVPIFTRAEFDNDREFRKTASVMKMVIEGHAAAGTISMGGYDYHTGDRMTGEIRDERAGRCIGACLEYAKQSGFPVMIYVFSDGSVASNGMLDTTLNIPKGQWTGDNSSTGASFFLVYNPQGRPVLHSSPGYDQLQHQQIGYMRDDASVETTSSAIANNVDSLVQAVVLNYMALHDEVGTISDTRVNSMFADTNKTHGLGGDLERYIAFQNIVSGTL
jgi:hypothetical protein